MWPFRRKKANPKTQWSCPPCPHCKSTHTEVITRQDTNQTDYIKIWRGQRYLTCRCLDCGRDFYTQEPADRLAEDAIITDETINEEELRAAEDELKRQTEEDGDHRYW